MKTIGQKWILFFVSCLFFIAMQAQDVKTIFQTANTYYKSERERRDSKEERRSKKINSTKKPKKCMHCYCKKKKEMSTFFTI